MTRSTSSIALVLACLLSGACSNYHENEANPPESRETHARYTIDRLKESAPHIQRFFDSCVAYAVFPEIDKGAAGVGGAHGKGVVYQNGHVIGYVTVSQASLGAQLGGQTYSEVIFFHSNHELDNLKENKLEFDAQASAVAASSGASANADYAHGVAIFTLDEKGLMFEASVGGQKFSYEAKQ